MGKLSDAISDCLTNTEILSNTGPDKDIFFEELSSAFEVLTSNWLRTSRNLTVTESILISLASILPLLPQTYDNKLISKLTPVLLNFCKKSNVRLAASRFVYFPYISFLSHFSNISSLHPVVFIAEYSH